MEKASIHGFITVELVKKHGRKIIKTENLLTPAGKEYILREGTASLFSQGTYKQNSISIHGANGAGPYSAQTVGQTGGSVLTNLLLNQPDFTATKRVYFDSTAIVAKAYADTSSVSNIGHITYLDSSTDKKKRVTRRFVYDVNDSYEFDTIALATNAPAGAAGIMSFTFKSLPFTPAYFTLAGCNDGEVIIKDTSDNIWKYNLDTGLITPETTITNVLIPVAKAGSVFVYGNYIYYVYAPVSMYTSDQRVYWYIFDKTTGAQVGSNNVRYYSGINYYDGSFYVVSNSGTTGYQLVENSSGMLVLGGSTVTLPFTQAGFTEPFGDSTHGFKNITISSDTGWGTVQSSTIVKTLPNTYETAGTNMGGTVFRTGEHICGWKAGTSPCQPTRLMLTDAVNLLSYHTFASPIQKNIGDVMNVSYSYYLS